MRATTLSAAMAVVIAGPVLADEFKQAAAEAPLPVFGSDWSGFYAGAQIGYGVGDLDIGTGIELDGALGGAQLGYSYDLGNWVIGGEIDYNIADRSFDGITGSVDGIARLKGRVGYDLGRALIYVTGGGAYASANPGGTELEDFGWAAGGGVDYLIGSSIIAGAEFLYHEFNDFDGSGADVQVSTVAARVSFRF